MHFGFLILQLIGTVLDKTPHNPHPSTAPPQCSLGVSSVCTINHCVPLASGRRVSTSSPSITVTSVDSLQNFGRTIPCTSSYCPSSPTVTKVRALPADVKITDDSTDVSLQALDLHTKLVSFNHMCDQLQHTDHVVTFLFGHWLDLQSAA